MGGSVLGSYPWRGGWGRSWDLIRIWPCLFGARRTNLAIVGHHGTFLIVRLSTVCRPPIRPPDRSSDRLTARLPDRPHLELLFGSGSVVCSRGALMRFLICV